MHVLILEQEPYDGWYCKHDRLYAPIREKPQDVSRRVCLHWGSWGGKTHPEFELQYFLGLQSGLNEKEKVKERSTSCLQLLPPLPPAMVDCTLTLGAKSNPFFLHLILSNILPRKRNQYNPCLSHCWKLLEVREGPEYSAITSPSLNFLGASMVCGGVCTCVHAHVCIHVSTRMLQHICGGQRTVQGSKFSPSIHVESGDQTQAVPSVASTEPFRWPHSSFNRHTFLALTLTSLSEHYRPWAHSCPLPLPPAAPVVCNKRWHLWSLLTLFSWDQNPDVTFLALSHLQDYFFW